jgi:pyruvate dehydrogenase E2 component (dihydrolipoamide acetyltransferase)
VANVELVPLKKWSSFRRLAMGQWETAYDPSIYGSMEIRMEQSEAYIKAFRERTGKRITVTHLVTKAVAEALRRCPEANAILRFNSIYLRKSIDLSVLVVQTDGGNDKVDLAACTIREVDKQSVYELACEMEEQIARVRQRKDAAMEKGKKTAGMIPLIVMNAFLKLVAFLSYTLNLRLPGIPRDPFGGATITNIGSLGLDTAFVPLVPYTRVPIFLAVGEMATVPVVQDGAIVPGRTMKLCATLDHRIIDGFHASVMSKVMHQYLEHPFDHFDKIETLPAATAA